MKDVLGIYIVDEKRKPIFLYEIYKQEITELGHAMLSNFISAFEQFADELGGLDNNAIELERSKILWERDSLTNTTFILRSIKEANEKKIKKFLNEIKNEFINLFTGQLHASEDVKYSLKKQLEVYIRDMINRESDVLKFLKSI